MRGDTAEILKVVVEVVGRVFRGEMSRASPNCRKNDILENQGSSVAINHQVEINDLF
jgi:hypothetical protein